MTSQARITAESFGMLIHSQDMIDADAVWVLQTSNTGYRKLKRGDFKVRISGMIQLKFHCQSHSYSL